MLNKIFNTYHQYILNGRVTPTFPFILFSIIHIKTDIYTKYSEEIPIYQFGVKCEEDEKRNDVPKIT